MDSLEAKLRTQTRIKSSSKPLFFRLSKKGDTQKLKKLIDSGRIQFVTDEYIVQLEEYFQVQNPKLVYNPSFRKEFKRYLSKLHKDTPLESQGVWVYYPWISHLVHILDEDAFFQVRTARNKNLITEKEQENYYNSVVGIAGMSIGNSVALAIVLQGGAKYIKLADFDTLELSNTNRIRTGIDALGLPKVEMTARQIYLLNPYAKVELFKQGLSKNNIGTFFKGLDIVVDEIDNLAVKYLIRQYAKRKKIPVVMGADNGDNIIIDIERYDKKNQPQYFHGRMGKVTYEKLLKLEKVGIGRMIVKHLGVENVSERMLNSFLEMGKTLVSWPQLGGAALMNGSAIAYFVRKILNNDSTESNRAVFSIEEIAIPSYLSEANRTRRRKIAREFKKLLNI